MEQQSAAQVAIITFTVCECYGIRFLSATVSLVQDREQDLSTREGALDAREAALTARESQYSEIQAECRRQLSEAAANLEAVKDEACRQVLQLSSCRNEGSLLCPDWAGDFLHLSKAVTLHTG